MITLKTLPNATAQEVYDQMAKHLLDQGKKSRHESFCVYKSSGGLKCAAGCFISDDEYSSIFENKSWGILVERSMVPPNHDGLIKSGQVVHDNYSVEDWPKELIKLAKRFNLVPYEK